MNRLKSLREERGMKQSELGKLLNVKDAAISKYESGKVPLTGDTLLQLSKIFNVPVDYILGNEKCSVDYANYQMDTSEFGLDFKIRLREILEERKLGKSEFAKLTGFHPDDADEYLFGNRIPSIEDLIKIAGALEVSTDYLLYVSKRKRISTEEEMLLQSFNRCDDECKRYLLAKAGVLCVEGISAVAAGEYGKYVDEEKKSFPSRGTEGKGA